MKTIILSFDDARSDFYCRALPIMRRYNIPSTLNVVTNFLNDVEGFPHVSCSKYSIGLTTTELLECHKSGLVEIACHGANHINTKEDVEQNIIELRKIGIQEPVFGFASPNSELTEQNKNEKGIWTLKEEGKLLYVRSGIQIRREGNVYTALSLLDSFIHSNILFWRLNRHNIIKQRNLSQIHILPSVTIFMYTKLHQLKYLIERADDASIIILMFHSILQKGDNGYGQDKFSFDADIFDALCKELKSRKDIQICMTKDLFKS